MEKAGPKRVLSLDGGGLRGVAAIAFLERIEARLAEDYGRPVSLCEHFDLIGGTSTGAILAAGLALNMPLEEIRHRYFSLAPNVFRRAANRIPLVHSLFNSKDLEREFRKFFLDRRFDDADLQTRLAVITKRVDTGSVWFLTNNPDGQFWDDPEDGSFVGNRNLLLANIVLASTAAPHYFDPKEITIIPGRPPGLFVDGSVSPHNNPSFALFQIATVPAYGFGWTASADTLDITSVGTGSFRVRFSRKSLLSRFSVMLTTSALRSIIADADAHILTLMQMLGRCETHWPINSEIGDLAGCSIVSEPLFTFRRYNLILENGWLTKELGATAIKETLMAKLRDISSVSTMQKLYEFAQIAAARQIPLKGG